MPSDWIVTETSPEPTMRERLVLDASVAIAIVRREPMRDAALRALQPAGSATARLFVPGHFWLEVGNVLIRRYRYSIADVVTSVQVLDDLGAETIPIDRTIWFLGVQQMERFGLSGYDAAYLALAESVDADLMTLDHRLASAAGPRAVPIGPHRLAEQATPYLASEGFPPRKPSESAAILAEFGRYVAELRREAMAG